MTAQDEMATKAPRPPEVQHDEVPSGVTDHAFDPKGLWYTLCAHCNLAESAHAETNVPKFHYVSDDMPDDD